MLELYAIELKNEVKKELFEEALDFVPEAKRNRIKRFLKHEDSLRSLIAEVLIRKIIILKLNIKNSEIFFKTSEHGKPYLLGYNKFHFNISHSGDWIVCGISDVPIGVDIEVIKNIDIGIAKRFFSQEETEDLLLKDESERLGYFFDLWTLKESYIKAEGRGLHIPLNTFSFKINNGDILFSTKNELKDCFFKQYKVDKNYKLSVCSLCPKFPDAVEIDGGERLLSEFLRIVK